MANRPGQWVKGQSGNPNGRPIAARQKIAEALLADLAEVWAEHGKGALIKLAVSDPGKLAQIAYGLLPRDIFIQVHQTGSPETARQRALMREIVDAIEENDPSAQPEILEGIREYVRAGNARQIGGNGSNAVAIEHSSGDETESVQLVSDSKTPVL